MDHKNLVGAEEIFLHMPHFREEACFICQPKFLERPNQTARPFVIAPKSGRFTVFHMPHKNVSIVAWVQRLAKVLTDILSIPVIYSAVMALQ